MTDFSKYCYVHYGQMYMLGTFKFGEPYKNRNYIIIDGVAAVNNEESGNRCIMSFERTFRLENRIIVFKLFNRADLDAIKSIYLPFINNGFNYYSNIYSSLKIAEPQIGKTVIFHHHYIRNYSSSFYIGEIIDIQDDEIWFNGFILCKNEGIIDFGYRKDTNPKHKTSFSIGEIKEMAELPKEEFEKVRNHALNLCAIVYKKLEAGFNSI